MIEKLIRARKDKVPVERPTKFYPHLTVEEAYRLQNRLVGQLIKSGEVHIGYKLSPKTVADPKSPGKLMPVYGYLFESMLITPGATLKKSDFIDLHLENEVAFVIGKDIHPKKIATPNDLKNYIRFVAPAIEMPEIRYSGPTDNVTGIDLIVDNVVASKIMLGDGRPPSKVDANTIKAKMVRDGGIMNEGVSTMVEGSPWNSLFWLIKALEEKGEMVKANQVIMTGGIAKFMDSVSGQYKAEYSNLGEISFSVE